MRKYRITELSLPMARCQRNSWFRTGVLPEKRRELVDFGYWVLPDGRDAQTQSQFEDVDEAAGARLVVLCGGGISV